MILVGGVGLDGGDDLVFADEARDVVDVAVGIVAGAAAVEPEDLLDAEVFAEGGFELLAGDAGVALLDFGEEALFGGDEGACAVDIDAAAFEDEAFGRAIDEGFGLALRHIVKVGDVLGDEVCRGASCRIWPTR